MIPRKRTDGAADVWPRSRRGMRAIRCIPMVLACLLVPGPVAARLVKADLDQVNTPPAVGARAPLHLEFVESSDGRPTTLRREIDGRPTLLLPVDFKCRNLCDPMASMLVSAARATGLAPGSFGLVLVGLDPRDGLDEARRQLARLRDEAGGEPAPRVLIAAKAQRETLLRALGYTVVYDPETDSFAHPATVLLLTPDGRLARVLSPLALTGGDLRLALVETGEGRIGDLRDRLTLICYGYDAAQGVYTPLIRRMLAWGGAFMVLGLVLLIAALTCLARVRGRRTVAPVAEDGAFAGGPVGARGGTRYS